MRPTTSLCPASCLLDPQAQEETTSCASWAHPPPPSGLLAVRGLGQQAITCVLKWCSTASYLPGLGLNPFH